MKYTVIRDTREKEGNGWDFRQSNFCCGTEISKLDVGDYSLSGYEDSFVIERKGSISEWARNVVEKRFYKELTNLSAFDYSYILLEFDMDDLMRYPYSSNIPRRMLRKIRMNGSSILRKTMEIQVKYRIPIIFCGGYGKEVATSLFKRFISIKGNS